MMKKTLHFIFFCLLLIGKIAAQWVEQASGFTVPKRGVNAISIVDANVVWAVANDGANTTNYITEFTKTTNGGTSWSPGFLSTGITGAGIANITAIDADTAWACVFHPTQTAAGGIWKTTNGGTAWSKQTTAAFAANSFPDFVYFWDSNHGIAVGDPTSGYFEVYTTIDGGTNWIRTPNTANQLSANSVSEYGYTNGFSVMGSSLWFCTSDGRVFKTTDKGITFTFSQVGNGISDAQRITFADSLLGYAAMHTPDNLSFRLAKTTDGGNTWSACANNVTLTSTALLGADVCAVPGTNYLVSVGSSLLAKGSSWSADGGNSWFIMEDTSLAPQRLCVRFLDANTGWAGSFNVTQFLGGISKTSGPVSVPEQSHPSVYRVFPNPAFNSLSVLMPTAKIKLINYQLYSAEGRSVLSGEHVTANNVDDKIMLDISAVTPGIYFLEINDGVNNQLEKIIHY